MFVRKEGKIRVLSYITIHDGKSFIRQTKS